IQVVPCPTHTLERHPVVEQGFDDLERDEVPERVQPWDPRTASGPLDGRVDQADLVPIPELTRGAPGELRRLMCGKSLHRNERPPTTSPSRHQRVPPARRGEVSTSVRRSRPRGRGGIFYPRRVCPGNPRTTTCRLSRMFLTFRCDVSASVAWRRDIEPNRALVRPL